MRSSLLQSVKRLVGTEGELGSYLGLDQDWSLRIIKQVGNYGESYKRNIADTGILPDRGPNNIWTQGGLLYTPPAR
jgi:general L-amino acid transport system substrate-binding protein